MIYGLIEKDVGVFLRTMDQVREMVRLDPFRDVANGDVKTFVTFDPAEPKVAVKLPLRSSEGDAEIILVPGAARPSASATRKTAGTALPAARSR